ncbi:MAG TPA: fumarylacetoacetate hydrolase family protein [Candidatus Binataceae bacterium]|nr:fumarylacetoacetate hydrolase family protein [Candidatus Binataceae bacterium]
MKIVRYRHDGRDGYGALEGDRITPLDGTIGSLVPAAGAAPIALGAVRLLAPATPSKIVAIGLNYADHAAEGKRELPKEPMLFIKPSTALIGPGAAIVYPPQSTNLHHEGELAIVIGATASQVAAADADRYILGYTCANDVTARDLQRRDVQFTRGKGFDTFAPLGPWIVTGLDPADLAIETRVNGVVRQQSRTSMLIFNCAYLVSFISHVMTLLPGDVISTGTPAGVGPMQVGDVVEVEIEEIGCLKNPIAAPR